MALAEKKKEFLMSTIRVLLLRCQKENKSSKEILKLFENSTAVYYSRTEKCLQQVLTAIHPFTLPSKMRFTEKKAEILMNNVRKMFLEYQKGGGGSEETSELFERAVAVYYSKKEKKLQKILKAAPPFKYWK